MFFDWYKYVIFWVGIIGGRMNNFVVLMLFNNVCCLVGNVGDDK